MKSFRLFLNYLLVRCLIVDFVGKILNEILSIKMVIMAVVTKELMAAVT